MMRLCLGTLGRRRLGASVMREFELGGGSLRTV